MIIAVRAPAASRRPTATSPGSGRCSSSPPTAHRERLLPDDRERGASSGRPTYGTLARRWRVRVPVRADQRPARRRVRREWSCSSSRISSSPARASKSCAPIRSASRRTRRRASAGAWWRAPAVGLGRRWDAVSGGASSRIVAEAFSPRRARAVPHESAIPRFAGRAPDHDLLATAGDRLALERSRFTGAEGAAPFEVETLQVIEVDAEGRMVAAIVFDPDDRRAASRELFERYARSDASGRCPPAAFAALRAMNDHDLEQLRAVLPRDFVFDDHRRTGLGRIEGAETFIPSVGGAVRASARSDRSRRCTDRGGAAWRARDGPYVWDVRRQRRRVRELLRAARAVPGRSPRRHGDVRARGPRCRASALRGASPRSPAHPAECCDPRRRTHRGFLREGNWPALRALTTPDFQFDDRRKLALVSGGVDMYVENLQVVRTTRPHDPPRGPLHGGGPHLALAADYMGGGRAALSRRVPPAARGRRDSTLRAAIHFDPDDRAAAFIEAHRRFAAGEAGGAGLDPVTELGIAFTVTRGTTSGAFSPRTP